MARISRRYSYRGQPVTVTFRDGKIITGRLAAWGTQVIRIRTSDGRWTERSCAVIEKVESQ